MRNLLAGLGMFTATVALAFTTASCGTTDAPYEVADFSAEMAQTYCDWIYGDGVDVKACCDSAEQGTQPGAGNAAACLTEMTQTYNTMLKNIDPDAWSGGNASNCVRLVAELGKTCDRNFARNAAVLIRGTKCNLVRATAIAGDICSDDWECKTRFCKRSTAGGSGVCANPLPDGAACVEGDVCDGDAVCAVDKCKALQPDGAVCVDGTECFSGACGAGKCINSSTYTCDGA